MDKPSKSGELNVADWKAQAKSALIFLVPSALAFLTVLTPSVDALVPDTTQKMLLLVVVKWGLDQVTGMLRRLQAGK